jgi:hypothetical protein
MNDKQAQEVIRQLDRIAYSLEYLVKHAQQAVSKIGVAPIDPPPNPPTKSPS